MFTSSSSPYLRSVIDVATGRRLINDIHQDILCEPCFFDDLTYVQSILVKDTVTVSYVLGQGPQGDSPTPVGYSVLYK